MIEFFFQNIHVIYIIIDNYLKTRIEQMDFQYESKMARLQEILKNNNSLNRFK